MLRNFLTVMLVSVLSVPAQAQDLEIISRADWSPAKAMPKRSAKDKMIEGFLKRNQAKPNDLVCIENQMDKRRTARYLTVHHTAEAVTKNPFLGEMKKHQNNMFGYLIDLGNGRSKFIFWGDTPYHYRINDTGEVAEARELIYSAKSNTVYSTPIEEHITVVLEGNFIRNPRTKKMAMPETAQIDALVALLAKLAREHNIPLENISYHSKVANSNCPGEGVTGQFDTIVARVAAMGIQRSTQPAPQTTPSNVQITCRPHRSL